MTRTRKHKFTTLELWVYIAAAAALFFPVAAFVPRNFAFEILNAVLVSASAGICSSYAIHTWRALRLPFKGLSAGQAYIVALFLKCLGLAMIIGGLWYWRYLGRPDWLEESTFWLAGRWVTTMGLIGILSVNWTDSGSIEPIAFRKTAGVVSVGVFLGLLSLLIASWRG